METCGNLRVEAIAEKRSIRGLWGIKSEHQRASDNVIVHNNGHHLTVLVACPLSQREPSHFLRPRETRPLNLVEQMIGPEFIIG